MTQLVQAVLDTAARMMDIAPIEGYARHLTCAPDACGALPHHSGREHGPVSRHPQDLAPSAVGDVTQRAGAAAGSASPHASGLEVQRAARLGDDATRQDQRLYLHECTWMRAEKRRVAAALCLQSNNPAGWLHPVLSAIVMASSKRQALAGLLATGPLRSIAYVGQKVRKRFRDLFP